MQNHQLWVVIPLALILSACSSSPKEQKDQAEAEYIQQKTKTINDYKACIKGAGTDSAKLDACERLLKAVPGLAPVAAPVAVTAPAPTPVAAPAPAPVTAPAPTPVAAPAPAPVAAPAPAPVAAPAPAPVAAPATQ